MALKRKLVEDTTAVESNTAKQMKLVPFPSSPLEFPSTDMDVDMTISDSPVMEIDAFQNTLPFPHIRLTSSVSTDSTSTDTSSDCNSEASHSPAYPTFDLYPVSDPATNFNAPTQPLLNGRAYSGLGFPHLRLGCKQIPKLRVACGSGVSGRRSMWGLCEECGAIQMLDS